MTTTGKLCRTDAVLFPGMLVRGKALIFWDSRLPGTKYGRKLDAIDTDQITPAADCVSESLDTLDERWKAGAFRSATVSPLDRPAR